MIPEPKASVTSQEAVTATSPAKEPFRDMDTSGLPSLIQVKSMVVQVATAGATVVVTRIDAKVGTSVAAAPLKPYQANHRINTPSAPRVRE